MEAWDVVVLGDGHATCTPLLRPQGGVAPVMSATGLQETQHGATERPLFIVAGNKQPQSSRTPSAAGPSSVTKTSLRKRLREPTNMSTFSSAAASISAAINKGCPWSAKPWVTPNLGPPMLEVQPPSACNRWLKNNACGTALFAEVTKSPLPWFTNQSVTASLCLT